MSQAYIVEVAIFTVKEEFLENIPLLRSGIQTALKSFSGFIELQGLSPLDDKRVFADFVKWESLNDAMAAAIAFESGDERFMPYMQAIEEVKFMGHFSP